MEWLSEDATYLAGGLGLLAGAFLIALRVTQQGKFLVWSGAALGLAALLLVIEWAWVTDNERIEEAVYGLARAVAASDTAGALDRMTPDVQYVAGGSSMSSEETRRLLERTLGNAKFDFLRLNHMQASAGGQSRRGRAEFRVLAGGSYQTGFSALNFGTHNSNWSLGLRETSPGVWKVNRITPVNVPGGQFVLPPTGGGFRSELPPPPTPPASTTDMVPMPVPSAFANGLRGRRRDRGGPPSAQSRGVPVP